MAVTTAVEARTSKVIRRSIIALARGMRNFTAWEMELETYLGAQGATYLTMSQHNVAGSLETVAEPEDHHKKMVKIEPPDEDVGVDAHLRPVRGRKRPDVHGDLYRGAFVKGDRDGVYLEDAEEEEEDEEVENGMMTAEMKANKAAVLAKVKKTSESPTERRYMARRTVYIDPETWKLETKEQEKLRGTVFNEIKLSLYLHVGIVQSVPLGNVFQLLEKVNAARETNALTSVQVLERINKLRKSPTDTIADVVNKITLIEAECEHAAIDPITEAQRIGALINATGKDRRYHDAVNEILMKSDEYAIYEDVKAHLLKQEIVFNQRDNRNREHHYQHRGRNMNLVGGEAMRPSASHGTGEAEDKSQVICPFHSRRGCLKGADCDMKHVGPSGGNKAKRRQTSTNKTGQWRGASGSRGRGGANRGRGNSQPFNRNGLNARGNAFKNRGRGRGRGGRGRGRLHLTRTPDRDQKQEESTPVKEERDDGKEDIYLKDNDPNEGTVVGMLQGLQDTFDENKRLRLMIGTATTPASRTCGSVKMMKLCSVKKKKKQQQENKTQGLSWLYMDSGASEHS